MQRTLKYILPCLLLFGLIACTPYQVEKETMKVPTDERIVCLPPPVLDSEFSLEQSLLERRSVRTYTPEVLTLREISQLLWAAQGVTDDRGYRTAPSAGGLYPLELYLVAGNVESLAPGIYRYMPGEHILEFLEPGDKRSEMANAALSQSSVEEGAAIMVITAVYSRTTSKYGERGIRYVHIEVGHAAQNICLQATALDLGTVTIGAFYDEQVTEILGLPEDEEPLYILPVGRIGE